MASPSEYAALSQAVYAGPGSTEAPSGWSKIDESKPSTNGYFGAAYKNDTTGEIVVANRGSRLTRAGLREDWAGSDVQIARQDPSDIPPAFGESAEFARSVQAKNPSEKITFTGHSLGGAEAQVQAASLDKNAVTFGAPGARFAVDTQQAEKAQGKIVNYVLPGDPVPMSGQHIGSTVAIMPSKFTALKIAGSLLAGALISGPLGLLVAAIGIATTHMLGNYIDALSGLAGGSASGRPQARIGDNHVCPMVTGLVPHVGGPIAMGSPNVLVGSLPAARVSDTAICVGPPDTIIMGSGTVLINNMPAARIGDMTVHGGVIVAGLPTVLTGG